MLVPRLVAALGDGNDDDLDRRRGLGAVGRGDR